MKIKYIGEGNITFTHGRIYDGYPAYRTCDCGRIEGYLIPFTDDRYTYTTCSKCRKDYNDPFFNKDIFIVHDINSNIKIL